MRKKTFERALREAMERTNGAPCVETIHVVEVRDFPNIQQHFDRNRVTIATQRAEIAALRMLLKEALGQLERMHLTTKTASPDFRRLVARSTTALSNTTLQRNEDE